MSPKVPNFLLLIFAPREILDSSLARKYGWRPKINLDEGFDLTYSSFKQNR